MIKNIVFDLGNVLISFRPSEFFDKKNYPENIKVKILSDIFASKEWGLLDNGEINTSEAINAIALKSSLKREEIAHVFNLRTEIMFPLDHNVRLLPELKKQGFRLYFLSNFPIDIFDEIKTGYYFFKFFDGGVISSEAKLSKPDRRIYELLCEKYSLIPRECLFIDDLEINVKSAEDSGMKGLITNGSQEISKEIEKALSSATRLCTI
ncbi:MAG TPA: HAD family phosphatase [Anaerovoracaceae bacterium]|nr:HAD family phosphatase [Anaerovoracaceae bacterium]